MSLFHLTARYCNRSQNLSGNNYDRCKFVIRSSSMSPMLKRELFVPQSVLQQIWRTTSLTECDGRTLPSVAQELGCQLLEMPPGHAFKRPRPREPVGGRGISRRFWQHRQASQTCSKLKS